MQNILISVAGMIAGEFVMNKFFRPQPPPLAPGAHFQAPPPVQEHPLMAYLEPTMDPSTKEDCINLFDQGSPDELRHGALELVKFGYLQSGQILAQRADEVEQILLEAEAARGRELGTKEEIKKKREAQNLAALEAERERISANIAKLKLVPPAPGSAPQAKQHIVYPAEAKQPEVFRAMPSVPEDEVGFTQTMEHGTQPIIDPSDPLPQVVRDTAPAIHPADLGLVSRSHGSLSEEAVTSYVNGALHNEAACTEE